MFYFATVEWALPLSFPCFGPTITPGADAQAATRRVIRRHLTAIGSRWQRRLIGTTLGRVHQALSGQEVPVTERFHWVDPAAGRCEVIDWSAALRGPLLYHLASPEMT